MVKKSLTAPQPKARKSAATSIKGDSKVDRMTAIEARLAALEMAMGAADKNSDSKRAVENVLLPLLRASDQKSSKPRKFWALEHIQMHGPDNGATIFAGQVTLPNQETYAWQIESAVDDLLSADWTTANARMASLAHPVRLAILKALLHGQRDTQSLQALPDMGTTGQLYHHLKDLEAAGWIRQPRRGEYNVLAERVVPLLTILSACEVTAR